MDPDASSANGRLSGDDIYPSRSIFISTASACAAGHAVSFMRRDRQSKKLRVGQEAPQEEL